MNAHLRDRFFQRYGVELTSAIMGEIRALAVKSENRMPDRSSVDREHVWVTWNGQDVGVAWHRPSRIVFTFLPARVRIAWCAPKKKRGRRRWGS